MEGYTEANYDRWLEQPYVDAASESEQHEEYQESTECWQAALDWLDDLTESNDLIDFFMKHGPYATRFEEWRDDR